MREVSTVVSLIKCGPSFSSSPLPSPSSGFFGDRSLGVGRSISRPERANPRAGWEGIVPLWVAILRVVL
jgi:hypothetical protein